MSVIDFPSVTSQASSWGLVHNTAAFASPLNGAVQTAARPGARWRCVLSWRGLELAERAEVQAFLAQLRGQENRFKLIEPGYTRRGTGGFPGVQPALNAAAAVGATTVTTINWEQTETVLAVGDYFKLNGELKMVVGADVVSGGFGEATITFEPGLRVAAADASLIFVGSAVNAEFMLAANNAEWDNAPGVFSGFTIEAIEAFT